MFIAHMPAGFLLSRHILKNNREASGYVKFLLLGLVSSIAPDFDLAYFYLIDNRQHPHHSYWTHIPFFWLCIYTALLLPVYKWFGMRGIRLLSMVLLCGLLHLLLDSFASGIKWLYPFDTSYYGIWRIPSVYNWWVANYLFHWTFLIELLICSAAVYIFYRDRELLRDLKYQILIWICQIRARSRRMQKLVEPDRMTSED